MNRTLAGLSVFFALLLPAGVAGAIPAFARKYETPCGACHTPAFPQLNVFGRDFKEAGYRFPRAAEAPYRERDTIAPSAGERLEIFPEAPLSLRMQSALLVPGNPQPGERALDSRWLESLFLVGGGSPYPGVSIFFATTLFPAALHHASVGFHDLLLGEGRLNVRLGRFLLLDFLRPEHRDLTRLGNPTGTLRVGLNPTALDSTQQGIEVFGRAWKRRLFYLLALVDGALDQDGLRDLDDNKDLFAQLELSPVVGQRVAAFGYLGRTQLLDQSNGVALRFSDRFWNLGGAAEMTAHGVNLFAQVAYASHDNPDGSGAPASYLATRAELQVGLASRWLGLMRYDRVDLSPNATLDQEVLTVQLSYLLLTNFRLSFESQAPLHAIDRSVISLRLDLAL